MPKILMARQPLDGEKEKRFRRLAAARHALADRIVRAGIVTLSWESLHVPQVATGAGCEAKTVRRWLYRFNEQGPDGLGDRRPQTADRRGRTYASGS
ncbi:helix-turn-helix domain-containing protein [Streptomyces sp. NPDC091387]|uniref:helix-turn-helix domain-containing protein n=1 Tax=Streptomyces sp. NPDC091387 TaxID=3365998 RepID=UPI0037FADDC5